MYGRLQLKSDMDRLYIKGKEGGRVLKSVERCVKEEQNSLSFFVASAEKNLIKGVAAAEIINTEDTVRSGEFKKQKAQEHKQNWPEIKSMDNSSGKCQRKLIRIELGNGYLKVI